ncbi:metallophosphoesterase [Thiocystis minor]|uniref:metallophosphoesterase n=1 Tax=Thiocystis minor TaxID=61597 RepID=UPI001911DFDD|nr:metallophosphoesterase [Thiocystis minor]MBK5967182.1 metallophosphoesterase [Thiocystis minor]
MEFHDIEALTTRIGRTHLRQRLGLEGDHEVFVLTRPGAHFFYPENWYSVHGFIRHCLRLSGLYERAQRNARAIRLRHNRVVLPGLPDAFKGFQILHLSDLHLDMDPRNADAIRESVRDLDYDICVLTGDYRAKTFGPFAVVLSAMAVLRRNLKAPIYAILGNHDTLRLVPGLEAMGIRVLLNETVLIERDGQALYLAGIDDAHYYRVHNIDKAAARIPEGAVSILLSHTPEIYRHAAHSGFDLVLCGHTHGGQICLPGGFPLTWDARCPRRLAAGPWRHGNLIGYTSVGAGTSVVNARLNCPPEITLHELQPG